MRVEQRVEGDEERLSTEEVHALRARLFGETSQKPKTIATVADLAEFLGRSPEEVWQQLDRLRAERAFAVSAPKKNSQLPLLGVAVVLLGAAYGIYKVTPRKMTDAEIDDRLETLIRERAARPRKIIYPITETFRLDREPVPGFRARFDGVLTQTTFQGLKPVTPLTDSEAIRRLTEELQREFEDVVRREAEAPKPTSPIPKKDHNMMPLPGPGTMVLRLAVGNHGLSLELPKDPKLASAQLGPAITQFVQGIRTGQDREISNPYPNRFMVAPPPGFVIQTRSGNSTRNNGYGTITLRPIDATMVRRRLELAIRDQIRLTMNPGEGSPFVSNLKPDGTLSLEVNGPLGPIKVTLPMKVGGKYKTAADAMREYERLLKEVLDQAEAQVHKINAGNG